MIHLCLFCLPCSLCDKWTDCEDEDDLSLNVMSVFHWVSHLPSIKLRLFIIKVFYFG